MRIHDICHFLQLNLTQLSQFLVNQAHHRSAEKPLPWKTFYRSDAVETVLQHRKKLKARSNADFSKEVEQ